MRAATLRRRLEALEQAPMEPYKFAEALRAYGEGMVPKSARAAELVKEYWDRVERTFCLQEAEAERAMNERTEDGRV